MGFVSQKGYEAKQRYAERKAMNNAEIVKDYFIDKLGVYDEDGYLNNEDEINNIVDELTHSIDTICKMRHNLHSSNEYESIIDGNDTPVIDYFYEDVEDDLQVIQDITRLQSTFKVFDYDEFYVDLNGDNDWTFDTFTNEMQKEFIDEFNKRHNTNITLNNLNLDELSYEYDDVFEIIWFIMREANAKIINNKNTEIENYLKELDKILGTFYCPTGLSRIF